MCHGVTFLCPRVTFLCPGGTGTILSVGDELDTFMRLVASIVEAIGRLSSDILRFVKLVSWSPRPLPSSTNSVFESEEAPSNAMTALAYGCTSPPR